MWDRLLVDCRIATMEPGPGNPLGWIRDFASEDMIDLSMIDADSNTAGDDAAVVAASLYGSASSVREYQRSASAASASGPAPW